nr:hypothetical protein [uncultured Oscillibacter sp.]
MSTAVAVAIKAGIAVLTDSKARKAIGWVLAVVLSPIILLVAFLCCLGTGMAEHNNAMMNYSFYGTSYDGEIPTEYQEIVASVRNAFSSLDSAAMSVNAMAETSGLDPTQVKAVYYVLCPEGGVDLDAFLNCFYTTADRTRTVTSTGDDGEEVETEESYTVTLPSSLAMAYTNLSTLLGHEITTEEKENIQSVYTMIAGTAGEGYDGGYLRGSDFGTEINISGFTDASTKNAHDLAAYAVQAWESCWGYVWGTYGNVLTESLLDYKVQQYPDGVGQYEEFIRANWLGGRTTDCVGLIKGYGWLDPDDLTIRYGTNGMPDIGANSMYNNATVKGAISTMPDIPGLAVWMDGHIGVYLGNGEVIEASSTKKGVIKTLLEGRGWSAWLQIPYINYD